MFVKYKNISYVIVHSFLSVCNHYDNFTFKCSLNVLKQVVTFKNVSQTSNYNASETNQMGFMNDV